MSVAAPWLRQKERGNRLALALMLWLTRRYGVRLGQALLRPIALYYLLTAGRPRAASRAYLRRALGREPSWRERFRHVLTFAHVIMDRILLQIGQLDAFALEVRGNAIVDELMARRQGFILLGAHFGNFEVLRAIADRICPVPVRMMMYGANAEGLHGFLAGLNPDAQGCVITIGEPDAALRAKEAIDAGAMVGILGDRYVAGERTVAVDFLGTAATLPTGPLALASVLQVPVVLFFAIHTGSRRYEVEFELLADSVRLDRRRREADLGLWAQRYAAAVEARCRRHPLNWFNFYDFWATAPAPARRDGRPLRDGGARDDP